MLAIITEPLGVILGFIYSFTNSYGLSIVLFTIIIRLVLLPLAIKQQKSMADMQKVQPLMNKIREKYKNDKEKLNQEMMKLYQENKVNPAGGCLPLIIQLPIIFGLYRVIYQPLTYILKLSSEQIKEMAESLNLNIREEISIAEQMGNVNLEFLGLNLAEIPNLKTVSLIWIVPILAALTTYFSSKLTTAMSSSSKMSNGAKDEQAEKTAQMQGSMMKVFPIMTGFICFSLPAGVGLYWVTSNLLQMIQQVFLNKYFNTAKKEVEE